MTQTTPQASTKDAEPFLEKFRHFESGPQSPAWLLPLRKAGMARFAELGFPTMHDEDWRFTNVAPLAKLPFKPMAESADNAAAKATLEKSIFAGSARFTTGFCERAFPGRAFRRGQTAGRSEGRQPRRRAENGFRVPREAVRPVRVDRWQFLRRVEPGVLPRRRVSSTCRRAQTSRNRSSSFSFPRPNTAATRFSRATSSSPGRTAKVTVVESYFGHGNGRVFHERRDGNCRGRQRGASST